MPRLGDKYDIRIEVTSKPTAEYHTDEYYALDLPAAPAVMVEEEIVAEGCDMAEHTLEACICRRLGLPEPEPGRTGLLGRLFKRQAPK